jgi:citrate synthase
MTTETVALRRGLEGIEAGESQICFIDGIRGTLAYRGYDIHELAQYSTYEEVAYLLWHGELPTRTQLERLRKELVAQRTLSPEITAIIARFPPTADPMDVLRTTVSAMGMFDPDGRDKSPEANLRKAVRLTAQMPTIVATFHRQRRGLPPVLPKPNLGHAANYLYMLDGKEPDELSAHTFDVALILHADHEFNASTFAARVAAATLTDIHSCITAAIGTLKGPLHGGANEEVVSFLREVGSAEQAEARIRAMLAEGRRIPGFGHRVYKTMDPRAPLLKGLAERLGERQGSSDLLRLSMIIQDIVMREKRLNPNVDFYSATTYTYLGIQLDLYTPIFAISRVAGWTAHVLEQYSDNRLIRPTQRYTGYLDRQYVPMAQRG